MMEPKQPTVDPCCPCGEWVRLVELVNGWAYLEHRNMRAPMITWANIIEGPLPSQPNLVDQLMRGTETLKARCPYRDGGID